MTTVNSKITLACVLVVLAWLAGSESQAQVTRRDSGGDARLQALVNQLNNDKSVLQAENTRLEAALAKAEQALETEKRRSEASQTKVRNTENELGRYRQSNAQVNEAYGQLQNRFEELVARFRETAEVLRSMEQERNELSGGLNEMRNNYMTCRRHNLELYETSLEVLDAFEGRGALGKLAEKEPFTRLARVKVENIADQYRYALEDSLLPDEPTANP